MDKIQFATRVSYNLAMLPDGERTRRAIAELIADHIEDVTQICLNTETCLQALNDIEDANDQFCSALLALADTETPLAPPEALPFPTLDLDPPEVPPLSPPASPH